MHPTDEEVDDLVKAFNFTVFDMYGNAVQLSDFFGKPIVLNFWTTWCPACVRSSPYFEQLHRDMGDEIHVLKINLQEAHHVVEEFMAVNGYTMPVYLDANGEAARAYSIRSIPDTFFINANGYITARAVGAMDESRLLDFTAVKYFQKI